MSFLQKINQNNCIAFCVFWLILFILYLPAAKAGFVTDVVGWLDQIENHSFWEYLNRTNFHVKSLYQFTQFTTYIFFKLFGVNKWLWHLLQITLHAINGTLLYIICKKLFNDTNIKNGGIIAMGGVLLYCVCPHISEVIVWESSFHYLQGFLLILLILLWVQRFQEAQNAKYIWWGGVVFFLSTYSLEVFYLTPWFVLALALYYRVALKRDIFVLKKTLLYFFVPELVLFVLHLITYRIVYGDWVAHIGVNTIHQQANILLSRPPEYLFHIVLFGRFLSNDTRQYVYKLCESWRGIIPFYALVVAICLFIITNFKKFGPKAKAAVLLFVFCGMSVSILMPLWFQKQQLLVVDRYTYMFDAFIYMLITLLLSFISLKIISYTLWAGYAFINIHFTAKLNKYWKESDHIITSLLNNFPNPSDKVVVLLNNPENMNGVPMIGSSDPSEFKMMKNLLSHQKINNIVFDVLSYNMLSPNDGAHVTVLNDSSMRVTLNQWGTWWWYNVIGATSYQNEYYKLNVIDVGHFYDITLKKAPSQYLLLYQVGDQWKIVDWSKKNVDQY
ncbi:MAG TPA: hypothetical protein VN721_16750 [Flavipsychrobacter sp.]|nr:hypothetical protein [Flavipsychrobacter sp.]